MKVANVATVIHSETGVSLYIYPYHICIPLSYTETSMFPTILAECQSMDSASKHEGSLIAMDTMSQAYNLEGGEGRECLRAS